MIVLSLMPGIVYGKRELPEFPRLALYGEHIGSLNHAEKENVARYDLLLTSSRPEMVDSIRILAAEHDHPIEILYNWMPQSIARSGDDNPGAWAADTTWSLIRKVQWYARQNEDWYLTNTDGERIAEWDSTCWAANWTRYCPPGVYGDP